MYARGPSSNQNNIRSIGIIAAWCDSETHFAEPRVEEYLEARQHRQLCEYVARGEQHNRGNSDDSVSQPHLSAAEISQRSVDLLLKEYYQMVQAQHTAATRAGGSGDILQSIFLLACPALPDSCDFKHIAAGLVYTVQATATLVVLLACVLVPAWLAVLRELMEQQHSSLAAAVAIGGLAVFLTSDAVHRLTAVNSKAAATAVLTPTAMQQMLESVASASSELATLRQASKSVTTPNVNSKHSYGHQQLQALLQQQQQQERAPSPGPPSGSAPSYLSLLPALVALQSALGMSSSEPPLSRERLADEIKRTCGVLGLPVTADMVASPAAMAATIGQLKLKVGI